MKPGAVLINTARGNVVDVAALVRALADERLAAAGLDVLPEEPLIREEAQIFRAGGRQPQDLRALVANHVLLRFPNVLVTPHNAYNTEDAVRRIIKTTLDNIEAFARGTPVNVVLGAGAAA
jgi:D-lactate dehydrogenase